MKKLRVAFRWGTRVIGLSLFTVIALYIYSAYFLALPENSFAPNTTKLYDRHGILLYEVLLSDSGKKTYRSLNEINPLIAKAFIAGEDKRFYSHFGIDLRSTIRAIGQNVQAGEVKSGGSTITQQLARNIVHPGKPRTVSRKFIEALYANRLEHAFSKDEILEKYLNTIYFGNLSYGIEAASRDYFSKTARDLDLAEVSLLAGLPQAPARFNPFYHLSRAKERQRYILDQMVAANFISEREADEAFNEELQFRVNRHNIKAPHFVFAVIRQLEEQYGTHFLRRSGYNITTTLDYASQLIAEQLTQQHVNALAGKNVHNTGMITIDLQNNDIVAWVGNANYFDTKHQGAVDMVTALRQPGSSLKPFTYLRGFQKGFTPASVLHDIPTQFTTELGPYTPKNYDLQYHGPVTIRDALANSYNIPAVTMLQKIGVRSLLELLKRVGISSLNRDPDHYGLSLTLGGGEVELLELSQAYSVIAHDGVHIPFNTIVSIQDVSNSKIVEQQAPAKKNVLGTLGAQHSFLIKNILSDNFARIASFGDVSYLSLDERPAAVKTGTTRNFKDNWTVGFTPQYLTGVWVGNTNGDSMENISGVEGAAPLWHDMMAALHEYLPIKKFETPEGIVQETICRSSGKKATDLCPEQRVEYFVTNTVPKSFDTVYQRIAIDQTTGLRWAEGCGPKIEKTYAVYQPELLEWAQSERITQPPAKFCNGRTLATHTDQSLAIRFPHDGDRFALDPTIPDVHEQITFKIGQHPSIDFVEWKISDTIIATVTEHPFSYSWQAQEGTHHIRATIHLLDGKQQETPPIIFSVY